MDLDLGQIRELVELLNQSDLAELTLEAGDVKLKLKKGPPATAVSGAAAPPVLVAAQPEAAFPAVEAGVLPASTASAPGPADRNLYLIRSPMVGTFYRAASPDTPPFVDLGQAVEPGQTVCIIEAMKLMNEIEAEHGGKVVKISARNGEPVEFGQILFEIER